MFIHFYSQTTLYVIELLQDFENVYLLNPLEKLETDEMKILSTKTILLFVKLNNGKN
jgi:hypothetical protein